MFDNVYRAFITIGNEEFGSSRVFIRGKQNAPRPQNDYAVVDIVSSRPLTIHERKDTPHGTVDLDETVIQRDEVVVRIEFIGGSAAVDASVYAALLRMRRIGRDYLDVNSVGYVSSSEPEQLEYQSAGNMVQRWILTIRCNCVTNITGLLETVEQVTVKTELDGSDYTPPDEIISI